MSYQKTKEFECLSFLYLITGNVDKLRKMLKIAEMRGDAMSRFHNALFLGDAEERVKVLESTGQLPLAYVAASTHGLAEDAARLQVQCHTWPAARHRLLHTFSLSPARCSLLTTPSFFKSSPHSFCDCLGAAGSGQDAGARC